MAKPNGDEFVEWRTPEYGLEGWGTYSELGKYQ
jgi:hypothetical protein